MVDKKKVLAGREAVDAYREAHLQLYSGPWHEGIPEEHTPLLETMVDALEKLGYTSTETDFGPKATEILDKFWDENYLLNLEELGFTSRDDFKARATEADRETLRLVWQ